MKAITGRMEKTYYFYLDSTPTHSYMKFLYKYPQTEFPYAWLVEKTVGVDGKTPSSSSSIRECLPKSLFRCVDRIRERESGRILIRIQIANRGPETATLHLLPTLWFRNTWSAGLDVRRPSLRKVEEGIVEIKHEYYGHRWLYCDGLRRCSLPITKPIFIGCVETTISPHMSKMGSTTISCTA